MSLGVSLAGQIQPLGCSVQWQIHQLPFMHVVKLGSSSSVLRDGGASSLAIVANKRQGQLSQGSEGQDWLSIAL